MKNFNQLIGQVNKDVDNKKNPYNAKDGRVLIQNLFFFIEEMCNNNQEKKDKMKIVCEWKLTYKEVIQKRKELALKEDAVNEDGEDEQK